LQSRLVEVATAHGVRGFKAEMLATNAAMVSLAKRASGHVTVERDGDSYLATMLFDA
jgi:hypothetical protein